MNGSTLTGADVPLVDAADYAVRHPLRPLILAGAATWLTYSVFAIVVWWLIHPYATDVRMSAWVAFTSVFLVAWLGVVLTMVFRQPGPEESVRVWGAAARVIIILSHIPTIWATWFLFRHCPVTIQFLLGGMFMSCSSAQIICSPENVLANRVGVILATVPLALWFITSGGNLGGIFAIGIVGLGVLYFLFCDIVSKPLAETVAARLESEEAARRLAAALADVAEERDAKTRFIAAASHDLGQPLQAASLFFDQTLRAPDPDQRSRAADGVRRAFASADQLLSHMLNHLRLEADAVDPHFARFAIGPAMARIAAQFEPAASAAGIEIRLVRSHTRLRLDKVLFERALGNLVSNAIEHSGGKRILMGARKDGDRVRIWVIDDGTGIARVDAGRIFDDYYRGSDSRAAVKSGFGLGLSSVRRIVALMHGTAGLDLRWLRGSAFYLDFPAAHHAKEETS